MEQPSENSTRSLGYFDSDAITRWASTSTLEEQSGPYLYLFIQKFYSHLSVLSPPVPQVRQDGYKQFIPGIEYMSSTPN